MAKAIQFALLYIYSAVIRTLHLLQHPPFGIRGAAVFLFWDPKYPGTHGVVAFVLPEGTSPEDFEMDLYGPFGYSSEITILGKHLYGRDTWGTVNAAQIEANIVLSAIEHDHPGQVILLAGVRKVFGKHIRPLNDGANFILPWK